MDFVVWSVDNWTSQRVQSWRDKVQRVFVFYRATTLCLRKKNKKLIRRWDSEHELFYDDIVHAQASAYAHWTDFIISTKYANASTYAHQSEFYQSAIVKMDSPIQPAVLDTLGLPAGTKNSSGNVGVGNYILKWRLFPPLVLPKHWLNNRADRINTLINYQK